MANSALSDVYAYIAVFGFFYFFLQYLLKLAKAGLTKENPVQVADNFVKQYGYSYDFVLIFRVFKEDDGEQTPIQKEYSFRNIVDRINNAKLDSDYFYSCQRDEVYLKIRGVPEKFKAEASKIDYRLLLDELKLRARTQVGLKSSDGKWIWKDFLLEDDIGISPYRPYEYIYCKYDSSPAVQGLYKTYMIGGHKRIFKQIDRIKLIKSILESSTSDGGAGLDIAYLIERKVLLAAFPLHDYDELKFLQRKWLKLYAYPWNQPLDEIKDYYGERIGLYFAYLGYYVTALQLPALLGLITYIVRVSEDNPQGSLNPYFSGFMVIWSTTFIEGWKRKQSEISMKWGTVGYEDEAEQERPQFVGEDTTSPIDGSEYLHYDENIQKRRNFIVNVTISLCLLGVILIVVGIFYFRFITRNSPILVGAINVTTLLIAVLNAVIIAVLNVSYINIAIKLNDYQNFRLDSDYEDELIIKLFTFQTVNSFASLTYVSFIQSNIGLFCTRNDCILDAATTLSTVFLSTLITGVVNEVPVQALGKFLAERRETRGILPGAKITPIEKQFTLAPYDKLKGSMKDYASLVIQFGFCVLFVEAFPLAPTLAFISGYIRIRIDGWKLCQVYRRPIPQIVEDILSWQDMIEVLGIIGVIYNFGLILFTSSYATNLTYPVRWLIFLTIEHVTFMIKFILNVTIDDIPFEVDLQNQRSDFLVSKVFEELPDDEALASSVKFETNVTNLVIHEYDFEWKRPEEEEEGLMQRT